MAIELVRVGAVSDGLINMFFFIFYPSCSCLGEMCGKNTYSSLISVVCVQFLLRYNALFCYYQYDKTVSERSCAVWCIVNS